MYNFKDLFIFEMANNHQGDINHGINIIQEMGKITRKYDIKAAVKLQFRHYETFIHPDSLNDTKNDKIDRFLSTRLSDDEFMVLVDEIRKNNMLVMVTPFDERSVDLIEKLNVDIIKIGSPSLYDFSLFEKVSKTKKPIIISSGGCNINHIDKLYNFFSHRFNDFALMHCVSVYPTPNIQLELNNITKFKKRYPNIEIGFSTHESPDNYDAIKIAYALGARIFEKHVGCPTDIITLNKYSANPSQVDIWVKSCIETKDIIGNNRTINVKEKNDLYKLYRGVFVNKNINKGELITNSDIFYAFPINNEGMFTGEFEENIIADKDYIKNEHLPKTLIQDNTNTNIMYSYIHKVKSLLNEQNIKIPYDSNVELSHHKGIQNIDKVGCTIVSIIECDEYTKKYIIMLPGQYHPAHYHKKKDETFYMLYGQLNVKINCNDFKTLHSTDILRIPRNTNHEFWTETGVIFEEISTKHFNDDSYYSDTDIIKLNRDDRKTYLYNWVMK